MHRLYAKTIIFFIKDEHLQILLSAKGSWNQCLHGYRGSTVIEIIREDFCKN